MRRPLSSAKKFAEGVLEALEEELCDTTGVSPAKRFAYVLKNSVDPAALELADNSALLISRDT